MSMKTCQLSPSEICTTQQRANQQQLSNVESRRYYREIFPIPAVVTAVLPFSLLPSIVDSQSALRRKTSERNTQYKIKVKHTQTHPQLSNWQKNDDSKHRHNQHKTRTQWVVEQALVVLCSRSDHESAHRIYTHTHTHTHCVTGCQFKMRLTISSGYMLCYSTSFLICSFR